MDRTNDNELAHSNVRVGQSGTLYCSQTDIQIETSLLSRDILYSCDRPLRQRSSFAMPDVGDKALKGTKEYIAGNFTFTVTNQKRVEAKGLMVMIWRPGEDEACFNRKETPLGGYSVSQGYQVEVQNAHVVFS